MYKTAATDFCFCLLFYYKQTNTLRTCLFFEEEKTPDITL